MIDDAEKAGRITAGKVRERMPRLQATMHGALLHAPVHAAFEKS
jgi:hypothetical protein